MENRLGLPNVIVAQYELEGFGTISIFLFQALEGNFGSAGQISLTRDTLCFYSQKEKRTEGTWNSLPLGLVMD